MTPSPTVDTTTLKPSYKIPVILAGIALALLFIQIWIAGIVALFGLFLGYQATTLRLVFTDNGLDVYRGDTRIRCFPYQDWQTWDIFWPPIPVLFYFREVNSIHFLPILFNPVELRSQLEERVPNQAAP